MGWVGHAIFIELAIQFEIPDLKCICPLHQHDWSMEVSQRNGTRLF